MRASQTLLPGQHWTERKAGSHKRVASQLGLRRLENDAGKKPGRDSEDRCVTLSYEFVRRGRLAVRPFCMSQRLRLRHELAALACHSSRGFQAELFLNGPCQICNLGTENRQQIIHGDDSEKVSMFIDYRETANAPVMHKPHGIEQVVIDVDHRGVSGHYLFHRGLRRLFFTGNNLQYDIPVREDPYWAGFIDYYQAANVLGLHELRCLKHGWHPEKSSLQSYCIFFPGS